MSKLIVTLKKYIWLFPGICGVVVFWLIPFIRLVIISFSKLGTGEFNGLSNYIAVIQSNSFKLAFSNTLIFMAITIPILIITSFLLAFWIRRECIENLILKESIMLPLVLPTTAVSILYIVMFDNNGVVNCLLEKWRWNKVDWFNSDYAIVMIICIYIWKYIGLYILIWLSGIININREIEDAAKIDGASNVKYIILVLLPNLKQVAYVCIMFMIINSFKVFREVYLLTGNYPNENIYMLQHIFNNWFLSFSIDKLSAGSILTAIMIGTILIFLYCFLFGKKEKR